MAGTPTSDQIKFGILRTRDLVELYYRGRMVVQVLERATFPTNPFGTILMTQDPRRIRYEIILANTSGASVQFILGTQAAVVSGNVAEYSVMPGDTLIIERNFRSDMEGVVLDQMLQAVSGVITPSVRETILTPLPVDEEP